MAGEFKAVEQARAAGYTDAEIVDHLAQQSGLDASSARSAGYTDADLLVHLMGKDPATGQQRTAGVPQIDNQAPDDLTQRRVERSKERSAVENTLFEADADPARNGTTLGNFNAGFGKSLVDTGRGLKQISAGIADAVAPRAQTISDLVAERDPSRVAAVTKEVDESRTLDQPLMRTGAGTLGNIAGQVAQTIPAMYIPGANTLAGSAAIGAGLGATRPVASGESRLENTTIGAAAGLGGPLLARGIGATWRGAKALSEPFTASGRERIAGRTLERFGVQQGDVANVTNAPTATGASPTLAEQITRPEGAAAAARLQDSLRSASPEVAASMAAREGENNAARVATLERNAAPRDAAAQARSTQAGALYKQAQADTFNPQDPAFVALMQRPALKKAMSQAAENMANSGTQITPSSVAALHEAKLAMDDQISALMAGKPTASTVNEAHAIRQAQAQLLKFIEQASPTYAKARTLYADLSKPVNQADIAETLLSKGSANTTDLSGTARLMPDKLTGAMRDEGKLMKAATGRDLGDDLSKVMTPQQLRDIQSVVSEVDRAAAVARAGNGPGSATAQRLAGTNIIEQVTKGLGLPESTAGSTVVQEMLARPLNFLFKGSAEPKLQATLGEIILNPQLASKAMAAASPAQRSTLARVLSNDSLRQAARASLPATAQANRR